MLMPDFRYISSQIKVSSYNVLISFVINTFDLLKNKTSIKKLVKSVLCIAEKINKNTL